MIPQDWNMARRLPKANMSARNRPGDLCYFDDWNAIRPRQPRCPCNRETYKKIDSSNLEKKTLVVLTQANRCEPVAPPQRSNKEERKTFFKTLVSDYKAAIHQTLKKTGIPAATVEKVKVVPVGIEYERELLDGTLWSSNFWFECINAITSTEGCAAIYITKVNRHRFKKGKDVTDKDFQQPIHVQPAHHCDNNAVDN